MAGFVGHAPSGVPKFWTQQPPGALGGGVVAGTLVATQQDQTLVAAGGPIAGGALSATQANQTLAATAIVLVGGTLSATQANQTLAASGTVLVGGTLGLTEQNDTIAAAGGVTVAATLGLTEQPDTLAAAGTVVGGIVGTLSLTQEANGLVAAGTVSGAPVTPTRTSNCLLEFETETHDLVLEDNTGFLALEVCVEAPPLVPGGEGIPHTFSRKRWRELQMLIAAEMAAVAKAEKVTRPARREVLLHAARAAAAAVDAAEIEGESKRLDALLVRNARVLREAIRTNEAKAFADAVRLSRAIVARQSEDDDEMISLLLLA
jgi:hypothetical protein